MFVWDLVFHLKMKTLGTTPIIMVRVVDVGGSRNEGAQRGVEFYEGPVLEQASPGKLLSSAIICIINDVGI
jgi:hypothetical protein